MLRVEICTEKTAKDWLVLRCLLWPDVAESEHSRDIAEVLLQDPRAIAFLVRHEDGKAIGFAEASLRADYVNGCTTSPVAFLEGIYVLESHRRQGAASSLCMAVEEWARRQDCSELASDADLSNVTSHKMHRTLGFEETERVIYFRKTLSAATEAHSSAAQRR